MSYNLSNITDNVSLDQGIVNINAALNSVPFIGFLVVVWLAVFLYANNRAMDVLDSLITTNFVVSIISILGLFAGLIDSTIIITPIIFLFVSVVIRMIR